MPELRCDLATLGMNSIDHALPACQSLLTMKIGHVRVATRGDMSGTGALGNDQTNTTRGALTVVLNIGVRGDIVGRLIAGHGSHDDTIIELKTTDVNG